MKCPNKHKAQVKHAHYTLNKPKTKQQQHVHNDLQRRIIDSLTTCPQIPPGIHLDLWNFISQLSQVKAHRWSHGNAGEEDEGD